MLASSKPPLIVLLSNAHRAGAVPHLEVLGDDRSSVEVEMAHLSKKLLSVFRHVADRPIVISMAVHRGTYRTIRRCKDDEVGRTNTTWHNHGQQFVTRLEAGHQLRNIDGGRTLRRLA